MVEAFEREPHAWTEDQFVKLPAIDLSRINFETLAQRFKESKHQTTDEHAEVRKVARELLKRLKDLLVLRSLRVRLRELPGAECRHLCRAVKLAGSGSGFRRDHCLAHLSFCSPTHYTLPS